MPTVSELKRARSRAHDRDRKVERLLAEARDDRDRLVSELAEEKREREQLRERRQEIRTAIEAEVLADAEGEGEHSEAWRERREDRLDELADLWEASEARSDRLAVRLVETREDIADLIRRDDELDRRIRRLTARIKRIREDEAGRLSRDFHIAEFDCRDGTPCPDYMRPHLEALCRDHLQPLRDSGGTVSINSGYRHAAYNAAIGGASQSYHVYELRKRSPAADHIQTGRSAASVQAWHDAHDPPDGMGYYPGFTHIDDRGYRSRWYGAA